MCEATYSSEEEIRLHLTNDHNAIVLFETEEQGSISCNIQKNNGFFSNVVLMSDFFFFLKEPII